MAPGQLSHREQRYLWCVHMHARLRGLCDLVTCWDQLACYSGAGCSVESMYLDSASF